MAAPVRLSVFIPHEVINKLKKSAFAFGYCKILDNTILINCTAVIEREKCDNVAKNSLDSDLYVDHETCFQFLGLIYVSEFRKYFDYKILQKSKDVRFIIRFKESSRSFHLEDIWVRKFSSVDVRLVIYDGYSTLKSQLLPVTKHISAESDSFISFLITTCHNFLHLSSSNKHYGSRLVQDSNFSLYNDGLFLQFISFFLSIVLWVISRFHKITWLIFKWCPQFLTNIFLWTALGQQFHQRHLHCSNLHDDFLARKPLSVKSKNLIFAILIDLLCGCLVTQALLNTDISNTMLESAISSTNDIVNGLTNLINWLMGAPAGLKLNIPLNNALGKFFLYHIYLWESYMMVVQPVFVFIFKLSTVIGTLGLTFILSLLNDVISLATIHIYCFYGYATRLYGYQIMSLSALWRLFRGKKWNPLRKRMDSYTYDVHQLYLGTLIFTVLLFLLPTVMVYYFVFTCLRILVLIIQGLLSRVINILTVCPAYSVISRIFRSPEISGDVYFSIFNSEEILTLSMQASQISLKTVIQLTLPDLKKSKELLTWTELISSIIWGKIIYPL